MRMLGRFSTEIVMVLASYAEGCRSAMIPLPEF